MKHLLVIVLLVFTTICVEAKEAKTAPKIPNVSQEELTKRYVKELGDITPEQRAVMNHVAELAHGFDLSYTVVAIAWQESNLGKYPVNLQDPSCGITHKNVVYYLKSKGLKDNSFMRNKICAELVSDIELATAVAIEDLEYWKVYHKRRKLKDEDVYTYMLRSYNGGYKFNSQAAKDYAKSVKARVGALKQDINFQLKMNGLENKKK